MSASKIPTIKHVVLIPSLHFRPLHTFSILKKECLEILQFLSKNRYKFTDILNYIGGAKGNLHRHLMILQSANLIHVHLSSNNQFYLSTRTEFTLELKEEMVDFIQNANA
ncbi:winged helix-turn-helix domain-containing protein [Lysinibacillus sphaericus]|uniref:winged helix-turn-helix domain-containing protein n=1 Tax=Lysinibacillus sphaericus TaxID=1421 RepID=UPI00343E479F